jgi:hypothetical protein
MTSEEFAKSITEHNSIWVRLSGQEVDRTIQLAKDYLALREKDESARLYCQQLTKKCAEAEEAVAQARMILHVPVTASLPTHAVSIMLQMSDLRAEVEKLRTNYDVQYEAEYVSKHAINRIYGGAAGFLLKAPRPGMSISDCSFNTEMYTIRWPKARP